MQQSESLDFLGFGSDGDRALPGDTTLSAMPSNLNTEDASITPDVSLELGVGDAIIDDGDMTLGYLLSVKYSNQWEAQDRQDNSNTRSTVTGAPIVDENYDITRTSNDINLGVGLSLGLILGDTEYTSNTLLLRQTHAETQIRDGVGGQQDRATIDYTMDWLERQFILQQFTGDHYLADLMETELLWQASFSQASMDNPDRRTYTFDTPDDDGVYFLRWSTLNREYNELTDTNTDFSVSLKTPFFTTDTTQWTANYGASLFSRSRDAKNTTLGYSGTGTLARTHPNNFNADEIVEVAARRVSDQSLASGDYDANWDLMAYYVGAEFEQFDQFKLNVGARVENSELEVNTADFTTGRPETALLDNNDLFLSLGGTYFVNEELQLRAAYYETQNRPDFRELAEALYIDPDSGDSVRGNSDLESADVTNLDLRTEYYLSDSESISLAYFTKDFDNPIEKVLQTGGAIYSFENGDEGTISGFELDFRKEFMLSDYNLFVSGNLSLIDSEVTISNRTRDMQGQPDRLGNFQIGLDDDERAIKYTMVLNYQGESLYSPSQANSDDIDVIQESRMELDLSGSYEMETGMVLKLRLKNLTDEEVELTQLGANYRSYKKGREVSLGLTYPL